MANFKKRAFSLALTLTMVLSMLPMTALAAEQETMELGAAYTTSDEEGTGLPHQHPRKLPLGPHRPAQGYLRPARLRPGGAYPRRLRL